MASLGSAPSQSGDSGVSCEVTVVENFVLQLNVIFKLQQRGSTNEMRERLIL